jgi:hypothetical protein
MNTCQEGQPFGGNANPLYNGIGLKGHPGQDWNCGWGTAIGSRYAGLVYKIFNAANTPNSDGFTEFDVIVDDGFECFEWQVGHLDPNLSIKTGSFVTIDDTVGTEANHGPVYDGDIAITVAMQKAGDQRGHHRHYQKRPLMKTKTPSGHMLTGQNGVAYEDPQGFYYVVWDFSNGYNGCVDPTLPVFNRTLSVGISGYDVYVMQRILAKAGFLTAEPTGYFGPATKTALMEYQNSKSLEMVGYVGPSTRAALSQELEGLPVLSGE